MKKLLFTLTKPEMTEVYNRYAAKVPEPLSTQFKDCLDKPPAVKAYMETHDQRTSATLFPTSLFFCFIFEMLHICYCDTCKFTSNSVVLVHASCECLHVQTRLSTHTGLC